GGGVDLWPRLESDVERFVEVDADLFQAPVLDGLQGARDERAVRAVEAQLGQLLPGHLEGVPGADDVVVPRRGVGLCLQDCHWGEKPDTTANPTLGVHA